VSDALIDQSGFLAQRNFRAVMTAMARPGRLEILDASAAAPAPLAPAAAALLLSLADHDTPVWLDAVLATSEIEAWLRFHTGASPATDPARAVFALIGAPEQMPDFAAFNLGTPDYPDRSTTLIIQVQSLRAGPRIELETADPLVKGFAASPLPTDFAERLRANRALFPRGVDLILVAGNEVMALPRSVTVWEPQ
jgi:alpha-D-ribose 1-methylphosphonate 5-triphosphate synthase subunit PhnH